MVEVLNEKWLKESKSRAHTSAKPEGGSVIKWDLFLPLGMEIIAGRVIWDRLTGNAAIQKSNLAKMRIVAKTMETKLIAY